MRLLPLSLACLGRFLQMDERTTLQTWTVMETLLGVIGFAFALVGWWIL
ncbi:protein of unknown function (plasmid) [Shinella sp. WSC3-e]|nr:protein of unknown function [Shinella sp. WSC3-e]